MFHPVDHPMERGWVGRIEDEHVVHLAAQTLQSFFTGGASAREHAVYPLDAVRLLPPVLHPPSIRAFDHETSFEFRNPAAIVGPGSEVASDSLAQGGLALVPRFAAVIGAGSDIGGLTLTADWRAPGTQPPKDRDFALGLGPVVVTPDELARDANELVVRVDATERLRTAFPSFDWAAARDFALEGTVLYPGDLLLGPAISQVDALGPDSVVEVVFDGVGALTVSVS